MGNLTEDKDMLVNVATKETLVTRDTIRNRLIELT